MAPIAPHPDAPLSLSALLDAAARRLESAKDDTQGQDGFLYSGNRHDSVPRALFLDRRLTPLERNAWQVFRLWLTAQGVTAFPTYAQLRPYLASTPCDGQASHETVARCLTLLRLTRWLSLVRRRRDPKTGRLKGNLYVLHDEPLTPFEAMQLDPEYLGLISHALDHASKAVQRVGYHAIQELADDPLLRGRVLPSRLQILTQRLARSDIESGVDTYPQAEGRHESEAGSDDLVRNGETPSSASEAGAKASEFARLRNPKQDRTSTVNKKHINTSVHTVPRARELADLRLPDRFSALKNEQQAGALVALRQVEPEQRQAVLDEWSARCRLSAVRNPAGYLFGIIQKAIRGEFKAWVAPHDTVADTAYPDLDVAPAPFNADNVRTRPSRVRWLLDEP